MIDLQVKMLRSFILLHGVRIYFEKGVAYYIQSLWIPMHWVVVTYIQDLVFIQNVPVTVTIYNTVTIGGKFLSVTVSTQNRKKNCPFCSQL